MRVRLTCEECGIIGEMEGTEDVLHYAAEALVDEHWEGSHYYPSVRFDWSDDE